LSEVTSASIAPKAVPDSGEVNWPAEVQLIMSALDAAAPPTVNRRRLERLRHRVVARLRLFADPPGAAAWILFTRDVTLRSLGFISMHRLPLGYGGWVELVDPAGRELRVQCTLLRCRETVMGWYDGALAFNRDQHGFGPDDR
jgi:hypothetical protein